MTERVLTEQVLTCKHSVGKLNKVICDGGIKAAQHWAERLYSLIPVYYSKLQNGAIRLQCT